MCIVSEVNIALYVKTVTIVMIVKTVKIALPVKGVLIVLDAKVVIVVRCVLDVQIFLMPNICVTTNNSQKKKWSKYL